MLLANMNDLQENKIPEEEVRKFMDDNGITIFSETSAKTGNNVADAFKRLGEKLLEKNRRIKNAAKRSN